MMIIFFLVPVILKISVANFKNTYSMSMTYYCIQIHQGQCHIHQGQGHIHQGKDLLFNFLFKSILNTF